MARSEARLSVDIWKDRDFLARTPGAQRLYMFLLSQADLTHIGTIALRERRWSNSAAGLTVADIERDLKELEAARYLVIDWDAEEVLIRSFIRGDKVYRQPQVLAVAAEQLTLVGTLPLRVALRVELERIAELDMAAGSRPIIAKMIEELSDVTEEAKYETAGGEGGDHPSDEGGAQALGAIAAVTTVIPPEPRDPGASQPLPPPVAALPTAGAFSAALALDPGPEPRTPQELVGWWIEQCKTRPPGRVIGHMSKEIKALIEEGVDPRFVRIGIAEWVTKDLSPSLLPNLVNSAMNRQPRASPSNVVALRSGTPMRSTTDERVSGWLDIAAAAREASS